MENSLGPTLPPIPKYLVSEQQELDLYAPKSMSWYVLESQPQPDAVTLGLLPYGEPLYVERAGRDVLFYGEAGTRALRSVVAGELVRMVDLEKQRMVIVTTEADRWQRQIRSKISTSTHAHVIDVTHPKGLQEAVGMLQKPQTDTHGVGDLRFTFVLDRVDQLGKNSSLSRAIQGRAWRDYANITTLASISQAQNMDQYGDFLSIVPIAEDRSCEIFGVVYDPAQRDPQMHLVRIFPD